MKNVLKAGTYLKNKNSFKIDNLTFYVKERKNPTEKKPRYFLAILKPNFQYISSLYKDESRPNYYHLDFNNKEYFLKNTESEIIILDKDKTA